MLFAVCEAEPDGKLVHLVLRLQYANTGQVGEVYNEHRPRYKEPYKIGKNTIALHYVEPSLGPVFGEGCISGR